MQSSPTGSRALARTLPPAGTRLEVGETIRWSLSAAGGGSDRSLHELRRRLADRFGGEGPESVVAAGSGRALLAVLLEELAAERPDRSEVVVPGYTCYSVAASVVRAGLSVRPLEIDPRTLSYDPEALESLDPEPVLAILSASLFGTPDDLPGLEAYARERSIHLIDDAAQALGAHVGGRPAGGFGVAGLVSLDKGKPLTALGGGLLFIRDPERALRVARRLDTRLPLAADRSDGGSSRGDASQGIRLKDAARVLGYGLFLRPRLYWILDRILDLGQTVYDPAFPILPFPAHLAPVGLGLLDRLDAVNRERVRTARLIRDALPAGAGILVPESRVPEHTSIGLRLPILLPTGVARDQALQRLDRAGLGATGYYPSALIDLPELRPHLAPLLRDTPGARETAERLLTLPTHSFVTEGDAYRIGQLLEHVAQTHQL